jgi:transcriptional regulator with XRE-family HTH domain
MKKREKAVKNDRLFAKKLAKLRKEKGFTQQSLADAVGIHITQLARYEGGVSQPTFDVIRNLAIELKVSADELMFDDDERQPSDDLKLQFETVSRFSEEEKKIVKALLECLNKEKTSRKKAVKFDYFRVVVEIVSNVVEMNS